jgi:hypothetical protein
MMKQLLILTMVLLVTSAGFGVIVPGGTDDYSSGAEVIYAQEDSMEVYGSGHIQPASSSVWKIAFTDPITDEVCNNSLVTLFQLPDRAGQLIEARALMMFISYLYNKKIDRIDVYGVGYFPAATTDPNYLVTSDMYYNGVWGADPDVTPLVQGIATQADITDFEDNGINSWFASEQEGSLRLSCWLNSLYDDGAVAGDYVLIRFDYNLKYSSYTNVSVNNYETAENIRIYYDLVDELSDTCPEPIIPEMDCTGDLPGDLNGDCRVSLDDFVLLAVDWLRCDRIPERLCY